MNQTLDFIRFFRSSSPYIHSHRGKSFVIAFGGEVALSTHFSDFIHDIALLSSLGVKLILVHGMRPQINHQIKLRGLTCQYHKNSRITTPEILTCAIQACGALRLQIESIFSMGLPNSPMHGASINVTSGNWITAKPKGIVEGVDFQHSGQIRKLDLAAISLSINTGSIALLSPIGYSPTGEIFNLNYDEVAREVAIQMEADKLIFFTKEKGMTDLDGHLVRELSPDKIHEIALSEDNKTLVTHAFSSCEMGVHNCHLLSYEEEGALLTELYTREGSGTLISLMPYEGIRQAEIGDVGGLLELIQPLEKEGVLVKRSRERLEQEIEHFCVIERGGMVVGCAALYPFPSDNMGELACLVVHPDYREMNRGQKMLRFIELKAKELMLSRIFVLTTHTAHWFIENDFIKGQTDELPKEKKQLYNYQRSSQVFFKQIS